MDPNGKVALISGPVSRVGQSVAEALARLGCHVALIYNRSSDSADEDAWHANLDVDLSSAFHSARRAAPRPS